MLDNVSLAPMLTRHKLNADAIESRLYLTPSLWRFWNIQKVTSEPESGIAFLQVVDDTNGNATVNAVPVQIGDSLATVDIPNGIRKRSANEPLAPVGNVNGDAIRKRHALKATGRTVNVSDFDIAKCCRASLRH
jgi:hypothetical protein